MVIDEPVLVSQLGLDLPPPANGWPAELNRRGIQVTPDDLGRPAISRTAARNLFAEHLEQQEAAARRRQEIEERVIEADRRFRDQLPKGIPAGQVPDGVTPGELLMLSDPEHEGSRRESVLEHALRREEGVIYHPLQPTGGQP